MHTIAKDDSVALVGSSNPKQLYCSKNNEKSQNAATVICALVERTKRDVKTLPSLEKAARKVTRDETYSSLISDR